MKPSELRGKSAEELQKELEGLLKAQFGLRMQLATQQLGNTSQMKKVKRPVPLVKCVSSQFCIIGIIFHQEYPGWVTFRF